MCQCAEISPLVGSVAGYPPSSAAHLLCGAAMVHPILWCTAAPADSNRLLPRRNGG